MKKATGSPKRVCPDCRVEKPAKGYYRSTTRKDGLSFFCRQCSSRRAAEYNRKRREADPEWKAEAYRRAAECSRRRYAREKAADSKFYRAQLARKAASNARARSLTLDILSQMRERPDDIERIAEDVAHLVNDLSSFSDDMDEAAAYLAGDITLQELKATLARTPDPRRVRNGSAARRKQATTPRPSPLRRTKRTTQ